MNIRMTIRAVVMVVEIVETLEIQLRLNLTEANAG